MPSPSGSPARPFLRREWNTNYPFVRQFRDFVEDVIEIAFPATQRTVFLAEFNTSVAATTTPSKVNLMNRCHRILGGPILLVCSALLSHAQDSVVFKESGGFVAVEAEHFFKQTETETRAFYLTTAETTPDIKPDGDPSHVAGASGGAYIEILPDTRRTHGDKLIRGTNFSPDPGKMAVVHYQVNFQTPGKYYVWVRAHSTGSEDNGLHVGIDGTWPASGQRLQWCEGKKTWRWDSKQRTAEHHCGEPHKIFLEVKEPGEHTISFSMREDGFEFDKWFMTTDREFQRPAGVGPKPQVFAGVMPKTYPMVPASETPAASPGVNQNTPKALVIAASEFAFPGTGFYLDKGKWAALHPEKNKQGKVGMTFPFPAGKYHLTLMAVGESDGRSTYIVHKDDVAIGDFQCPLSTKMFEEGNKFQRTWNNIDISEGDVISVTATIGSEDGQEYSRARWAGLRFEPADQATKKKAAPMLAKVAARMENQKNTTNKNTTKSVSNLPRILPRKPDGDGSVDVTGELKQWHKVTLTLDGPYAHEQDNSPNPFTDYEMAVQFRHSDGTEYIIPGFFAADGNAGETSAESGTAWRAHFAPDRTGDWSYAIKLRGPSKSFERSGTFQVAASDKTGRDLRAHGRLQYVRKPYLRFAGSGQYFIKAGADAPETLLGYADFDNTVAGKPQKVTLKTWQPHVKDWRDGDPTWKGDKGKGLIGAINYLSGKGCNAFSFLTYNAGGDGDNVWPFIHRDDKLHYDCSKLDQWGVIFDHGTKMGMYLHFKMQETENDDGKPVSLDGGDFGPQRKLYCRELIARFGHNLALNWNLGEENTQTTKQQQAMLDYIAGVDAYGHNRVLHTFPNEQDKKYLPLLGDQSQLTGLSLQNSNIKDTHSHTAKWSHKSAAAGKPWVVAFDESGSAAHGQCPDLGYKGFDGRDNTGKMIYTQHEVRKQTLWGHLMGGGAGVEYYFGYKFVENDLVCEDWRSRDQSWDYCRIAINFFHDNEIPFWDMTCQDQLVGNPSHDNSRYCLAENNAVYLVYLPDGGTTELDLGSAQGRFDVRWFDPRSGGKLQSGSVRSVTGGESVGLGNPPSDVSEDWLVVVRAAG